MAMRSFLLFGCLSVAVAAASVTIACSSASSDGGEASGADLSAAGDAGDAGPDSPQVAAQKKLAGAWLPVAPDTGVLAVVIEPSAARLRVTRDLPHKAVSNLDKQEVDRTSTNTTVLSFDGTRGKLEMTTGIFVNGQSLRRVEDYDFEVKSDGGKDTLTLTETGEQVVQTVFVKDAGSQVVPVDAGTITLRPALELTRTSSWCARPRSTQPASGDCNEQFNAGVFKPTDMPPACAGNEDLCMRCENHQCKTHEVSSCELARNTCVSSIEACEFVNGAPSGQVATIDTDGKAIDCNKSPRAGKAVCCQDLTGNSNGDDDDDDNKR
jgi:hypothetical protein